jgi:hypothetical protein
MLLNIMNLLKKKHQFLKMYKIFLTIALIAIFWLKQSLDTKKYKVEFENKLEFNAKELHAVIAEVWNINN